MRRPSLGAIFLTVFLDLLGFGLVIPFLAEEARDNFHTTAFVGTLLGAVYSLMQFVFVPVWGRLSDNVGRRPVLVWSVAASAISMCGLGLAIAYGNSVAWLFAARIFSFRCRSPRMLAVSRTSPSGTRPDFWPAGAVSARAAP